MTDATITGVTATTGEAYAPAGAVETVQMEYALFLYNSDGEDFPEIHYESIHPGVSAVIQQFTLSNRGENPVDVTIEPVASTINPLGNGLETYLSTYLSTDQSTWTKSLPYTLNGLTDLDFYMKWQPPSTATLGEKQWTLHVGLDEEEAATLYINSFTVTSTATGTETNIEITKTIPYESGMMRTDFGDVRFYLGATELSYHLKTYTTGVTADFVIKIPEIDASETLTISVYSGDPDGVTTSDPDNVYLFYDDFLGTSIDTTKWPTRSGTYSVADGILTLTSGSLRPNVTFTPPFSVEMRITERSGNNTWNSAGLNHAGQEWDIATFLGYSYTGDLGAWTLHSQGCSNVTETLSFPTNLEMKVASNAVYDNYHDGVWYQGRTGGTYSSPWTLYLWAGSYRTTTIKLDYIIFHKYPTSDPTISDLGTWSHGVTDKEIKGGVLYQTQDLPELESEIRYGCKVGGVSYE